MSNPFDNDEENKILEGFLCPICKQDFKIPDRLILHVETKHSEDKDVLKPLKDMFSKAKKILKIDEDEDDLTKIFENTLREKFFNSNSNNVIYMNVDQTVGVDCDHLSYFRAIRTPRLERYATETNKLIIRLHKLLTDRPTDPIQIKQHEQRMVPWIDGKSVNLCPNCAKSFHLARRRHHCRLCGSIMCHDCSSFLDIDDAYNLVNPSMSTPTKLKTIDEKKEEDSLRVCEHCLHLLQNRKEMQDSRTYRPPITLYYDKMECLKKEVLPDIPMYSKIVNSLYEGDSIFTIADAGALREKIGRAAEKLDNISKAILSLPCQSGSREEALKKAVRLACIQYIKEEMLSTPPLPVETEIIKLQTKRRQETEQRIERDRRLASEAMEKYELSNNSGSTNNSLQNTPQKIKENSASGSAVKTLDNWSGHQADTVGSMNDPLAEQINIIKGYIKQARQELRFDEVETLEINLNELQHELYIRLQQQEHNKYLT